MFVQFWAWYKGDRLRLARISMSENNDIDEEDEVGDESNGAGGNNSSSLLRDRMRNNSSSLGDNMIMPYADEDDASEASKCNNKENNDVRL